MKRNLLLALAMIIGILVLAACSGNDTSKKASKESNYPNKPINLIISYAAGGNTDVGARILVPLVEEELGVKINIINKPGGGGWVGWNEFLNSEPDGYTIGYLNTPNLFTGYMNPNSENNHDLDDFAPIANHVTDPNVLLIRKDDERFSDINELIEYAKNNEVTATSTGVAGDDHLAMLKINKMLGTQFVPVHNEGSSESAPAVLGGHVDVLMGNVGEATPLHNNGDLKAVAVMYDERAESLPDVPTLDETGYGEVVNWSARGLAAPAGIDSEKLEILIDAFDKALRDEGHIEELSKLGLDVDIRTGEDYEKMLYEDEAEVKDVIELVEEWQ